MRKFQSLDRQAKVENDTLLETVHQNSIKSIRAYSNVNGAATKLSTSGLDGQLVIWDLKVRNFLYYCVFRLSGNCSMKVQERFVKSALNSFKVDLNASFCLLKS